jgi:hypothetical protein
VGHTLYRSYVAIHIKTDTTSTAGTSDTTNTPTTPIPDKTRYLHYDNLGSIDTITDGDVWISTKESSNLWVIHSTVHVYQAHLINVFMLQLVDMLLFCLMQINNFRIYIISTLI